jgi:hypothetical protein
MTPSVFKEVQIRVASSLWLVVVKKIRCLHSGVQLSGSGISSTSWKLEL